MLLPCSVCSLLPNSKNIEFVGSCLVSVFVCTFLFLIGNLSFMVCILFFRVVLMTPCLYLYWIQSWTFLAFTYSTILSLLKKRRYSVLVTLCPYLILYIFTWSFTSFVMYLLQCSALLLSISVCIYVTYFGFFRSSLQQLMKGLGKILQKEGFSIMAMNFVMRLNQIL